MSCCAEDDHCALLYAVMQCLPFNGKASEFGKHEKFTVAVDTVDEEGEIEVLVGVFKGEGITAMVLVAVRSEERGFECLGVDVRGVVCCRDEVHSQVQS